MTKVKTKEAPQVEWPPVDPATVAPVRDGRPDMYNYMPTRFVTLEEARARKWAHYYTGQPCSHGHQAPRFASNPSYCIDCKRAYNGLRTIGNRVPGHVPSNPKPHTAADVPIPHRLAGRIRRGAEPDPLEKRFLRVYAETKDFVRAATELGRSPADFQARLSYSKSFREAVEFLEEQYGLSHTQILTDEFEWTEDRRAVLLRVYVNSGDLAEAIRVTGCTNWHYEQELKDNPEFSAAIDLAQDPAKRALAREAVSRGLRGNDRLLQTVLEANLPEYSKRMDINFNIKQLTDEQLNQRLFQLLRRADGIKLIESSVVVDGECYEDEPGGEDETPGDFGVAGEEGTPQSNLDLL